MRTAPAGLLVFLGGGLGALLRYLISLWLPGTWAAPLPLAVLLINLTGAAALGAVAVLADELPILTRAARLTVTTGVLGGFTTWSTFTVGTLTLARHAPAPATVAYVALSLVGGPLAVSAAAGATRRLAWGARRGGIAGEGLVAPAPQRPPW